MAKHKTLGQVFTPLWIVKKILDLIEYYDENVIGKYILEPSSGDGAFLLEIVDRYIDICLMNGYSNDVIKEHLETYIYAVELDEIECNKSINNLNNLVNKKLNCLVSVG